MMLRRPLAVSLLALTVAIGPAQAQLFGESDEVKAARQAHEDGQDSQISDLTGRLRDMQTRLQSLESSLQRATGANESLAHEIELLQGKIDQQNRDFNYRLCVISAQQLGTSADETGLNCAAATAGNGGNAGAYVPPVQNFGASPGALRPGAALPPLGAAAPQPQSSEIQLTPPPTRGRPPGTLGTLPMNSGPPDMGPPPVRTGAGDTAQFDTAMNLMAKAQYAQASAAFQAYADAHPEDTDLTPQAIFWVGNMAYVQQDYQGAARSFAVLEQKYPKSSRAADGMLKLGQSLIATGDKQDGCTALASVTKKKFPAVSDGTLAAATNARKASACR